MPVDAKLVLPNEAIEAIAEAIADRVAERLAITRDGPGTVQYMTVEEAAAYLRWPKDRLYKLTAAGAVPHRKHGNRILLRRDEIDVWLDRSHYAGPGAFDPRLRSASRGFQEVSSSAGTRIDKRFVSKDTLG